MTVDSKQYVIQKHTTTDGVHWDLMLQVADVLCTWRLDIPPAEIGNEPIKAERIFDHPLRFLTYEGPVQNKTGSVCISDKGVYTLVHRSEGLLDMQLEGAVLSGRFEIRQDEDSVWHFCRLKN